MAIDNSPWDAGRAMKECQTAADYNRICALDRGESVTALRARFGLPHHYLSKAPDPNAAGVRAAMAALGGARTGDAMTGAGVPEARAHLERHMAQIRAAAAQSSMDRATPREEFRARLRDIEVRHSGNPDRNFTARGYAAIYDEPSLPLVVKGERFIEKFAPGSMDEVLSSNPDVRFLWDHEPRYTGARTSNGTLALLTDPNGLAFEAQVGNYSWAKDLRLGLERRDISGGSIGFVVGSDSWSETDGGMALRTINEVSELYDVTVTSDPAYLQTSVVAARSFELAGEAGLLPTTYSTTSTTDPSLVTPSGEGASLDEGVERVAPGRVIRLYERGLERRRMLADLAERAGRLRG